MELYLAILGLILSFFFAGSEAAYTVFNKLRLDVWKKRNVKLTSNASLFVKSPEKFFSTILVGNNFANTLYTTFATVFLITYFDETLALAIITIIVLFFGEILPKSLFRSLVNFVILEALILVRVFYVILKPFITVINYFVELFLRLLNVKHQNVKRYFSREEMKLLLREGYGSSASEKPEQKYISKVLGFSESKVREAMVPRAEMITCPQNTSISTVLDLMVENRIIRIPLYDGDLDNIIGIVFMYDIMIETGISVQPFIKLARFVPDNKSCLELLKEFQSENISTAIVLDEYGGTAGIITTDDLIEEVFGEFQQIGEITPQLRALNDFTWLVDARIELDELSELLDMDFRRAESETLAGFLLDKMGRIPKVDEIEYFKNFRVEIVQASDKKIEQVKIIFDKTE